MFVSSVLHFCFQFLILPLVDVVMDAGNTVAEGAIGSVMTYLEKNKGANVAKKSVVEVEGSEAYVTVEKG